DSFLHNQPGETRLDHKDQEFLIGHILGGSMERYYDRTKTEELRTKYSKQILGKDETMHVLRELAMVHGIDTKQAKIELGKKLGREPDSSEEKQYVQDRIKILVDRRSERVFEQKIVDEGELQEWLADGWLAHTCLQSGKVIIQRSS